MTDAEKERRKLARAVQQRRFLMQSAVKALVNEAVRKGSSDNVSAVLVFLAPHA